jgi:hypothetical protein
MTGEKKKLHKRAVHNLVRAVHEAGRALPHSWVAKGDPDLHSLRGTEEWRRLMRRLERGAVEATAPRSFKVAKQSVKIAQLASRGDPRGIDRALADLLEEEAHDPVPLPETPLRPAQTRQRWWAVAAAMLVCAAVGVVLLAAFDDLVWGVAAPLAVILLGLAVAAGYRVRLATTERWPELPTAAPRRR